MPSNYDFQAALNAAKEVVERQENGGSGQSYTYPLVYPPAGNTMTVRLLFNPASGQIVRLINRHEKIACYRTYGIDCPICSMMQQVKDVTGQDPFGRTKSSRSRGIAFAQYCSSAQPISKGGNRGNLQPGDIVLLMFPWSVYSQINSIIQAVGQVGPSGMDQAFCHANSGLFLNISVTADFTYTTTNVPYMTFPSANSDEEFLKLLDGLENLNEMVLPSTITEEVDKQVKEYTDAIYRQYLAPRLPNQPEMPTAPVNYAQGTATPPPAFAQPPAGAQGTPSAPPVYVPPVSAPPVPQTAPSSTGTPYTPPTPSSVSVEGNPQCHGNHNPNDSKCMICPAELTCMQASQNKG